MRGSGRGSLRGIKRGDRTDNKENASAAKRQVKKDDVRRQSVDLLDRGKPGTCD